ncbi:Homeobox protein Hox-D1 [Stylophora pistillata]|uniref:Homeobox protein Hox-D1 n=1 Tax=Stylophora pistillata TaxID=50429 RepID=A0A2B4SWE0_STYPI|nr:Homeobox protein Hox-D1 [Stylophora pistillata]
MEQAFGPEPPPIQEVVIPFLTKEEMPSQREEQESPEIPADQPVEHKQVFPNVEVIKKQACRTRFTIYQRAELEATFSTTPYLTPSQRVALASRLRVKPVAVQSWFKNRRFKWRKEVREGSQASASAFPSSPPSIFLMYQPRFVYSSGQFPVSAQCQGCFTGQSSRDSYSHVDFTPYPYSSH